MYHSYFAVPAISYYQGPKFCKFCRQFDRRLPKGLISKGNGVWSENAEFTLNKRDMQY